MPVRRPLCVLAAGLALGAAFGCSSDAVDLTADVPRPTAGESQPSDTPSSGPSDEPTQTPTEQPTGEPPPEDGACRLLTTQDIPPPTNDDPTVSCKRPHTSETIHVGHWPREVIDRARDVDDPALGRIVGTRCSRAFRRTVGGGLEQWSTSILSWAWFKPSQRDFAAGANWFRCDLIAGNQTTKRLEPLPRRVEGVLDGSIPNRLRACWTRQFSDVPGANEGQLVSCSHPHVQRAVGVTRIGSEDEPYPGVAAVKQRSSDRCRDQAGAYLGYPSSWRWGFTWPQRQQWVAGDRHTTCWAVTPR